MAESYSEFSIRCLLPDEGAVNADPGGTSPYVKTEDNAVENYLNTTSDAPLSTELWPEIFSWLGFLISDHNNKV